MKQVTHSVMVAGFRFKMTEGAVQSTNAQLLIDTMSDTQRTEVLKECNRIKCTVARNPVLKQLMQVIILGCLRTK